MNEIASGGRTPWPNVRQAALIAGIAYLLMPVSFAEFYVFPRLSLAGNVGQTVQNITSHQQLFFIGILCHFITAMLDIVVAWALYVLLAPVNRALSLLAAWFRLVYAVGYLVGLQGLVSVLYLVNSPYYRKTFGSQQLYAQVTSSVGSFQHSINLAVFGIHLLLLGYLIYKSRYLPWILGIVLAVVGTGWIAYILLPYLFPNAPLGFIPFMAAGELLLPLWLVIRGWKIPDP